MNSSNPVSATFGEASRFLEHLYAHVTSPSARATLAGDLAEVQKYINDALPIVEDINTAVGGNKTIETVMALAVKYGLQSVTPQMLTNSALLDAVLQKIALAELQKIRPDVSDSILNCAIELAVRVLKAQQAPPASA